MEVPQNIHFNGIISLYYRQSILGYPILANFHINGSSNYYDGGSVNTSNYVKPYLHPLQQKKQCPRISMATSQLSPHGNLGEALMGTKKTITGLAKVSRLLCAPGMAPAAGGRFRVGYPHTVP